MGLGGTKIISNEVVQIDFLNCIRELELPIIDYFAIAVLNTTNKTSMSIMSNLEWQRLFKSSEDFAKHDPVRWASFSLPTNMFSFDDIDYRDSYGKKIMQQRRLYDMQNGFIVMDKHLGYRFILTMATGYKKFQFQQFYFTHQSLIKEIFVQFKTIISPVAIENGILPIQTGCLHFFPNG